MSISRIAFNTVNKQPSEISETSHPMALVIDVQNFDRMAPEDAKVYADHLAKTLAELRDQNPPVPVTWVAMRPRAQFYEPENYTGTALPPVRDENTLIEMGFDGVSEEYKHFILKHGPRVNEAVVCKSVKSALLELHDAKEKPDYRKMLEENELGSKRANLADYFSKDKTLADYLREQGVNKTILMGAVSSHCIAETAFSAALKGFNPVILYDTVLSWHGDENTVNPRTSLLLWRGTGESEPDRWNSFHQGKIEEKIQSIAADSTRRFENQEDVFRLASQFKPIFVRPVAPSDWSAYRDYYKGLADPHHFSGFLTDRDLDAPETYSKLFDNTIGTGSLVMFGLWHGDKMIGQSSIDFFDTGNGKQALLAGSEIADEYRGQRLVNRFYQARMQHLKSMGFEGEVITTIRPDNHSSQKAAERNGFVNTGNLDEHGLIIFTPKNPTVNLSASKSVLTL